MLTGKGIGRGLCLTLAGKFNNQHAPDFTGDVGCCIGRNKSCPSLMLIGTVIGREKRDENK